ncbi:MAG TPA: hypothetical protein EYP41_03285 [Anaerolineae bacterium]|nr:hypothetical protein [Anaerolineae bacterium]HIP72236.1 hypothetical protein [Anaerolineae bacterium]
MAIDLATEIKQIASDEPAMKEYSVIIDGIIEMTGNIDEKSFFNGLLDVIIDYVEKHEALAGISMSHKICDELDNGEVDGAAGVTGIT